MGGLIDPGVRTWRCGSIQNFSKKFLSVSQTNENVSFFLFGRFTRFLYIRLKENLPHYDINVIKGVLSVSIRECLRHFFMNYVI